MLDNLRAMAIFVSVVDQGSFGGAGKELGITTSAVSQQIRALELDLGVVLLHRSTRKLSLTEAGASLYESAKQMVKAAEEAKENIGQLRDGLLGSLKIATTPMLARNHIFPALSAWLDKHSDLSIRIYASNDVVNMIDERVDVSIFFATDSKDVGVPLMKVEQILVASPAYMQKVGVIESVAELQACDFIGLNENDTITLSKSGDKHNIRPNARLASNDGELALSLAKQGYGVVKTNAFEVQEDLQSGRLVRILPEYQLPQLVLYGKTTSKEHQPAKVWRCLEVLIEYFGDK